MLIPRGPAIRHAAPQSKSIPVRHFTSEQGPNSGLQTSTIGYERPENSTANLDQRSVAPPLGVLKYLTNSKIAGNPRTIKQPKNKTHTKVLSFILQWPLPTAKRYFSKPALHLPCRLAEKPFPQDSNAPRAVRRYPGF
jgi:hypothetical protein